MIHRSQEELILDSIVFQNRNKAYGAFNIRQEYNSHLKTAIIVAFFIFTGFSFVPRLADLLFPKDIEPEVFIISCPMGPVNLDPVPEFEKPPVKALGGGTTTEFLPPRIVENDVEVVETTPDVTTLTGNPGTETINNPESPEVTFGDPGTVNVPAARPTELPPTIVVQVKPEFDGYVSFLQNNIRYPAEALRNGISGRVVVGYILNPDGTITDVQVMKGIGYGCDEEAVRVVKLMSGKWTPGMNGGVPVRFKTMIPINFRLPQD